VVSQGGGDHEDVATGVKMDESDTDDLSSSWTRVMAMTMTMTSSRQQEHLY
jgi:hypothetical protein